jgi:hypothetical protein
VIRQWVNRTNSVMSILELPSERISFTSLHFHQYRVHVTLQCLRESPRIDSFKLYCYLEIFKDERENYCSCINIIPVLNFNLFLHAF